MKEETKAFLDLFEEVFDQDWHYSKSMLGIVDETTEQKELNRAMGLETIDIIASNGTFINPLVEDEYEDWGSRGELLKRYRELKAKLNEK